MGADAIGAFWQRVQAWARATALPADALAPPASDQQLDDLDAALVPGCPPELRALLAHHNGAGAGWYCFYEGNFLAADEIVTLVAERSRLAAEIFDAHAGSPECMGAVRPLWWSELWVPFLMRNAEPVCIDLGPAPGGRVGQIVVVDWEGRLNRVVSDGLESFLDDIAGSLN